MKGERNVKKQRLWKKWSVFCAAMATTLLLSGCMFALSPDDLYSLPKLPEEYVDLEQEIAALVDSGYEYAAPTGGENVQPVQMVDIDGDGEDEALLFLRKSGESKPLKIYIFKQSSEGYQTAAVLEESGASIERVDYQDMNGDGVLELIVGCRIMTGDSGIGQTEEILNERALIRVVSVYNLERYNTQKILEVNYNRCLITDLDCDGTPEMIVIAGGTSGNCTASAYSWRLGALEQIESAPLSVPPAMLESVRVGGLTDGAQALFVTGVVDAENRITDLLVMENGVLVNRTMDEQSGISGLVYHAAGVEAQDIDQDGVLELPIPYALHKTSSIAPTYWGIRWTAFAVDGRQTVKETTYHNPTDGWYLVLPESWKDVLMVTSVTSAAGERIVTFGVYQGEDTDPLEVIAIYTESGESREYKATKGDRFILMRQATTIYAAEFLPDYSTWSGAMSADALKDGFRMIRDEWYLT